MKELGGYCISGPYARQFRKHWSDRLIAPILLDASPYPLSMDMPDPMEMVIDQFEYEHVQHFYVTEVRR